jgi:hypothetical protein
MDEKQLKALYEAMSRNMDLGTYDSFKGMITGDANFRKAFYDEASQELDLGDYQSFDSSFKPAPKPKPAQVVPATIKTGFGESLLDHDIDKEFDLSLSNPELYRPEDKNSLRNLYYKSAKKRFDERKVAAKAEVKSSPETLAAYTQKRVGEINTDIAAKEKERELSSFLPQNRLFGSYDPNAEAEKERYYSLGNDIQSLNLFKEKLKSSVANEAAKKLTPAFIMQNYDPYALGRELIKVADPELEQKYQEAEKAGAGIPGIQNAQLERLGLDVAKDYLQNQEQTDEVKQRLALIEGDEKDFEKRNFELTAQRVKDKLGVYFYNKGKGGFWGYKTKDIEQALSDPELGLTEAEREIGMNYVLPIEKKLFFSTEIPGSGFWRSGKDAIEQSLLNTTNTLSGWIGQRGDPERAYESLNAPVEESRFTKPGESQTLKNDYARLAQKGFNGTLTEEDKKKQEEISKMLDVRTWGSRTLDGIGAVTGQVLEIALLSKGIGAGGRALKLFGEGGGLLTRGMTSSAIGTGLSHQATGIFLSSYLNAYDSYRKQALELMPGDKNVAKRDAYANTMSAFEGVIEQILPDVKVLKAFTSALSPTVKDITGRLINKEITLEVARREFKTAAQQYFKPFAKEFSLSTTKESGEEGLMEIVNDAADSVFGGQSFDMIETGKNAVTTFLTTALHSPLVAGMAAHGAARRNISQNGFFKSALVSMGANPMPYLKTVEDLRLSGDITQEQADEKTELIQSANKYLAEMPVQENFDAPTISAYLLHRLNEDILRKQIGATTDPVLIESMKKEMERSLEIRKGLVDETIAVTPAAQEVTDKPAIAKELKILDTKEVNSEDLIGTPFEKPIKESKEIVPDIYAPTMEELSRSLPEKGKPGYGMEIGMTSAGTPELPRDQEPIKGYKYVTYRDEKGKLKGVLEVNYSDYETGVIGEKPQNLKIFVDESERRKGVGTKLLQTAESSGIDLSHMQNEAVTDAGAALVNKYLSKKADASNPKPETEVVTPVEEKAVPSQPVPGKPKEPGLMKKAASVEDLTDPRDIVLKHFAGGGKVHPSVINKLFGGKDARIRVKTSTEGERKSRISLLSNKGQSIEKLAHQLWEANKGVEGNEKYTTEDYRNAVEEVLIAHKSAGSMAKDLVDRYINKAVKQELTPEESEIVDDSMIRRINEQIEDFDEETRAELADVLKKYQNEYGFIDWKAIEKDTNGFDPEILNLSEKAQLQLYEAVRQHTEPTESESDYAGSKNDSGSKKTNEQKAVEEQLSEATKELTAAKSSFDSKRKELDKGLIADQEDLFGERKSSSEAKLFDERVDPAARDKAIQPFKERVDKAKAEVERLQKKLSDLEGKDSSQKELFNETTDTKTTGKNKQSKQSTKKEDQAAGTTDQESGGTEQASSSQKLEEAYQNSIGLKPNAKATTRIPVNPIVGKKPKDLSQIIFDVAKNLKQRTFFAKFGRRRLIGTYSPSNKGIAIKYRGDLDTTAHEVGHAIDDEFSLLPAAKSDPGAVKELKELSKHGSKPPKKHPSPKDYRLAEGWAEWIRAFLVDPDTTKATYPKLYGYYEKLVSDQTKKSLDEFSTDIRTWRGATAIDRTKSNIEFEPKKEPNVLQKLFKKVKSSNKFTVNWFDRMAVNLTNPLQVFEKAWKHAKGIKGVDEVLPEDNPIILARIALGMNAKFGEILKSGMIDAKGKVLKDADGNAKNLNWLLEPLDNSDEKSIKKDMEEVIVYMVAERTLELGERFGRRNILTGIGGGIISDVDGAREVMEEFKAGNPERLKRMKEAAERYREFADDVLRYMVDKGRMSEEQYELIKEDNTQYVALQRVLETTPEDEIVVYQRKGGKLGNVNEVIYNIKGSTAKIINPYISLMDTLYKSVKEADRNEVMRAFRDMIYEPRMMHDGAPKRFSDIGVQGTGDNAMPIFVDGKKESWIFQKDIYKALKGLDYEGMNLPVIMTFAASALKFTTTNFPVFAIRNVIRDTQDRLIKSNENRGLSGFRNFVGKKEDWAEIARRGGLNAGYYVKDKKHYYGLLEQAMEGMAKNKRFLFVNGNLLKHGWEKYTNALYKSETVNRVAEYRSARAKAKREGMDDYNASLYAAFKARDLIDFAVMGHWMKTINKVIPFSNAAVQGIRSTLVRGRENPTGFIARTFLYSMLPSAALWFWNHRDKETGDEYEDMPAYMRDMFWLFKIGFNKWGAIPKPYELSLAGAATERALSKYWYGNEKAFDGFAGSVMHSLPFDDANFAGGFQSIIEATTNWDFFRDKYTIQPDEDALYLALRHTESASRLGQWLEKNTGWDGRKWDHFIKGSFSYMGNLATDVSDLGREGSKYGFDITDTGLFKNSPAYNSPAVQDFLKFAKGYDLTLSSEYKDFSALAAEYFSATKDEDKDRLARELIEYAEYQLQTWKEEDIATEQIEDVNERKEERK